MAKIATGTVARVLARGEQWSVDDVLCNAGPENRPFEEQHSLVRIAIVVAGSFQYRSAVGRALMTPGSLLLGKPEQHYECAHQHAVGDRCLSFGYTPALFERITGRELRGVHVPPLRALSPTLARAVAALAQPSGVSWEEISVELAARAVQAEAGLQFDRGDVSSSDVERVTRAVRAIERHVDGPLSLTALARVAGQSPYHFLRTFRRLTGVTPHQYVLRARLRDAAMRLTAERERVIDVAFGCGFGDVSNFNRTFRAEFGMSPRQYRATRPRKPGPAARSRTRGALTASGTAEQGG